MSDHRTGRMIRAGDLMALPGRTLADLDAMRHRVRAERIARYGWDETVWCSMCGDTGYVPSRSTPCTVCEKGRALQEHADRMARWQGMMPRRFADYTLDGHPNQGAAAQVRAWCMDGAAKGVTLFLPGNVGTGKTGIAIAALRELFLAGRNTRYVGTVADLLDTLRPSAEHVGPEMTMRLMQALPVLLLDDLGTERLTPWAIERLQILVNARYGEQLPMIVTTNQTLSQLDEWVGPRIMSRLTTDACVVPMAGTDLRRSPPQPPPQSRAT